MDKDSNSHAVFPELDLWMDRCAKEFFQNNGFLREELDNLRKFFTDPEGMRFVGFLINRARAHQNNLTSLRVVADPEQLQDLTWEQGKVQGIIEVIELLHHVLDTDGEYKDEESDDGIEETV